jgi:hypothetical protein
MSSLLVFKRDYKLEVEIQSVMLVFSTPLVKDSSNLLTGSPLPPLPYSVNKYRSNVFILRVTGEGDGIGLCGKHIQELNTVYLTRF